MTLRPKSDGVRIASCVASTTSQTSAPGSGKCPGVWRMRGPRMSAPGRYRALRARGITKY
eukprot:1817135-Alexandrium_andersonii.AAC.1